MDVLCKIVVGFAGVIMALVSRLLSFTPAELEEEREQLTVQEGGYCSGSCGWWPIHLPGRASVPPVADQVEILVAHVGRRRWLHTRGYSLWTTGYGRPRASDRSCDISIHELPLAMLNRRALILGWAYYLDAFSSYPLRTWLPSVYRGHDNWYTRGASFLVLSY
ncbi:hypothetical protein V6N11_068051 [Hibiscus sabdariffa]|uniref:Uncharacterized protein n=1 Tax=Hibiscus sabdariffa TaxID=183260 RepID=A0ABR2SSI7_9ROSI